MLHLVLDHSAFVPCGDKPQEEKEAIRKLGELLPELDAIWYTSTRYLKVLQSVFSRDLKHHHPLPKLQASLMRTLRQLLGISNTKESWCKPIRIAGAKLQIHVIAREALERVGQELRASVELLTSEEDREVLALTITATRYAGGYMYLVSTDRLLLQAAEALMRLAERLGAKPSSNVKALTPSQLLKEVTREQE